MNLNYKWVGYRNDGPFLLLLHEALGSIGQWKDFPERLHEKLKLPILVYERTGHGNSPQFSAERTDSYLQEYAQEELPAFLKSMDLFERPMYLYGHSDGGSIALMYASKHPKNIKGLISEAAHVFVEKITIEGINAAVEYNESHDLISRLEKYHPNKANALFWAWAETWRRASYQSWNIEEYITTTSFPSLIVQGKNDQYGSLKQVEVICDLLGNMASPLVLDNVGHAPWKEATDVMLEKTFELIEETS